MSVHLYLSLIPEALIASMFEPEEFATYYALGEHDKPNGQAVFIEIDPAFRHEYLPIEQGLARCVPGVDGKPKSSVYISIYRVMEHIPIAAMGDLYYVTRDGRYLRTAKTPAMQNAGGLHFYYELAPVRLSVVSSLGPGDFHQLLTGHQKDFQGLPAIAFIEMELGELASDPESGSIRNLPYSNIEHLRRCLLEVRTKRIPTKIFDLSGSGGFLYRVLKEGVFIGNRSEPLALYAMPSNDEQRRNHRDWWRSANV